MKTAKKLLIITIIICVCAIPVMAESITIVFDDPQCTQEGTWNASGALTDISGVPSMWTEEAGVTVTYTPAGMASGVYEVWIYKLVHDHSTQQSYTIYHNGTTDTSAPIDFTQGEDSWVSIGTYDFSGDGNEFVKLINGDPLPEVKAYRTGSIKLDYISALPEAAAPAEVTPVLISAPISSPQTGDTTLLTAFVLITACAFICTRAKKVK